MPQLVSTPKKDFIFTPCVSLFASRMCVYTKVERYTKTKTGSYLYTPRSLFPSPAEIKEKKIVEINKGLLSKSAQRNIRDVISLLVACSSTKSVFDASINRHVRFKVNLITLTLSSPQQHPDSYIVKNLLEPFLRIIRNKLKGFLYFWKAEKQDNGNIHFHITSNRYINCFALRRIWNKVQCKAGYLSWQALRTTNSTDVHAVKNVASLSSYICSYLSKKDLYKEPLKRYHRMYKEYLKSVDVDVFHLPRNYFNHLKDRVSCRLWDCSKALKVRRLVIEDIDNAVGNEVNLLMDLSKDVIVTDYVTVVGTSPINYYKTKIIKRLWFDFTSNIRQSDRESVALLTD